LKDSTPRPTIVLDRDGVINRDSPDFVKSPREWVPIPGSIEAIARLCDNGYRIFVASNQSGIGRGLFDRETLGDIHEKMIQAVAAAGGQISGIVFCPHHPADGCSCRKPEPGLLMQIATQLATDPSEFVVVGDSDRDLEAARRAGAKPVLVRTGNGQSTEKLLSKDSEIEVFDDLAAFAAEIVRDKS
jgi:D-glycero-D-manno-heptose 1,7-bisphosphate phosphatase